MKKTIFLFCFLSLIMAAVFIGCSDDDEDSIVSAAVSQGYILAYVGLQSGELDYYGDVMPMQNGFHVDSVVVEDTMAFTEDVDHTYWWLYGDNNYQWTNLYSFGTGYSSGDTVDITFYHSSGVTSTQIQLLDENVEPNVILPIDDDTVSLGTNINFLWNSIPGADWYGIYKYYYVDSSGTSISRYNYYGTTDTTYTIPDFENIYDGYIRIYIVGVNGPGPDQNLNINGSGVVGELHSATDNSNTQVYTGTGDPTPVSSGIEDPTHDPSKVREAILNHFRAHELRNPDNQ